VSGDPPPLPRPPKNHNLYLFFRAVCPWFVSSASCLFLSFPASAATHPRGLCRVNKGKPPASLVKVRPLAESGRRKHHPTRRTPLHLQPSTLPTTPNCAVLHTYRLHILLPRVSLSLYREFRLHQLHICTSDRLTPAAPIRTWTRAPTATAPRRHSRSLLPCTSTSVENRPAPNLT
jgi:hypothetical protein